MIISATITKKVGQTANILTRITIVPTNIRDKRYPHTNNTAAMKRFFSDVSDTIGNRDTRQTETIPKSLLPYAFNAIRNCHTNQLPVRKECGITNTRHPLVDCYTFQITIRKCTVANTQYTSWNRYTCQSAPRECPRTYTCHAIGYGNVFKICTLSKCMVVNRSYGCWNLYARNLIVAKRIRTNTRHTSWDTRIPCATRSGNYRSTIF